MRLRRKLDLTLYLSESSALLLDRIQSRNEIAKLITLFLENIDEVLSMDKGKKYVTTEDFEELQQTMLQAVAQVISSNSVIHQTVKTENTLSEIAKVKPDLTALDAAIDIKVTGGSSFGNPDTDDDDDDFVIT